MRSIFQWVAILIFLISTTPAFSQTPVLDSLSALLKTHSSEDTAKVKLLNRISEAAWRVSPQNAEEYGRQALTLAETLGYKSGMAAAYRRISTAQWARGNYGESLEAALNAVGIYEALRDPGGLGVSYRMLGLICDETGDLEKAIYYHKQSQKISEQLSDSSGIAIALNNLGAVYYKQKNFEQALQHFKDALTIRRQRQWQASISESMNNIGEVYVVIGNVDSALVYLNSALQIKREINDVNGTIVSLENLGAAYFKRRDHRLAESYFQKALELAQHADIKKWQLEIYGRLLDLEESRGNYAAALDYHKKSVAVKDSLFSETKSRQIAELQTEYETEKKEQEIALLQRDKSIRTLWQNIFGLGLGIALVMAFLIYRFYRFRSEKNRQLFEAQQAQTRQLQEVDQMKSNFFANISHEFRTPLTLILGLLDKHKQRVDDPESRHDLSVMRRNATRLLQLINQLLDLSKLEAGGLKLRAARGDLARFLKQLVVSFASLADQKKIDLRFNDAPVSVTAHTPIFVYFDRDQMEKIFYNLLSNAFKFTRAGGSIAVTVGVGDANDGANSNFVEIAVTNTGTGIPADKLPHIFDRFYQVTEDAREYEGTGIGLALVKELVALHRGEVTVESIGGAETTFIVRLPLGREHLKAEEIIPASEDQLAVGSMQLAMAVPDPEFTEPSSQLQVPSPQLQTASPEEIILIVEDHADLRDFIRDHLKGDYEIIEAENGSEGLPKAIEQVPDLIISDIMMPKMNGYELCESLKANEATNHIPVILLTARAARDDKLIGLETGADDYLTKPFDAEELKLRVRNLIQTRRQLRQKFSAEMLLKPSEVVVPSTHKVFLERVTAVIERYLDDEDFSVENLGAEVGLSRGQLHRKLRALTNQSPSQFIRSFRMQRAAELIRQEAGNIAEIAYRVGFSSQAYFTRCFSEEFGCTPSEFRKGVAR